MRLFALLAVDVVRTRVQGTLVQRLSIRKLGNLRQQVRSVVFFFSSRRRHTRSDRDWSSDVCSSDLTAQSFTANALFAAQLAEKAVSFFLRLALHGMGVDMEFPVPAQIEHPDPRRAQRIDRKSVV